MLKTQIQGLSFCFFIARKNFWNEAKWNQTKRIRESHLFYIFLKSVEYLFTWYLIQPDCIYTFLWWFIHFIALILSLLFLSFRPFRTTERQHKPTTATATAQTDRATDGRRPTAQNTKQILFLKIFFYFTNKLPLKQNKGYIIVKVFKYYKT